MITLKQLGELSGLSIRTVSRILRGAPHVQEAKRERVLQLAREHHYVPNMAARNLRLQDNRFVGVVFDQFNISAATKQLNALNRKLTECAYYPVLGQFLPSREQDFVNMLNSWAGTVKYVIVMYFLDSTLLERMQTLAQNLPLHLIFADCANATPGDCTLAVDRQGSICDMFAQLIARGFTKLLFCGSTPSRCNAFLQAKTRFAQQNITFMQIAAASEASEGYRVGPQVMNSGAQVVFFDTDRMAAGFYRFAAEHNVRIPHDMSVIGFDDDPASSLLIPSLSTLAHPVNELAQEICNLVLTGEAKQHSFKMPFIIRDSIKK